MKPLRRHGFSGCASGNGCSVIRSPYPFMLFTLHGVLLVRMRRDPGFERSYPRRADHSTISPFGSPVGVAR
jgi:hypothetical protein